MRKKISFREAKKRFEEQGRTDIVLLEDGYNCWIKKAKFFDKIINEYFWAKPHIVFYKKSVAPLRKKEKTKQTCLEKYGVENPAQSKEIQNKIKKTNFEKYGVECYLETGDFKKKCVQTNLEKYNVEYSLQSPEIKKKIKKTNLKKYGTEYPAQSKEIQNKIKQTNLEKYGVICSLENKNIKEKIKKTNLEKYGVEYPAQSETIYNKIKKTNLEKYGVECSLENENIKEKIKKTNLEKYRVEYPAQSKEIQNKIKQTNLEKYGVECVLKLEDIQQKREQTIFEKYGVQHTSQVEEIRKKIQQTNLQRVIEGKRDSSRFLKESGEHFKQWFNKQPKPKPGYSTLIQHFPNEQISLSDLEEYFKNYKDHKTNLEIFTEKLFNIKHFNKKPQKIDSLYRPDFQLSDQIFLNVDGLYWHCEDQKDKWYHFNLRKEFEDNGLQIFQFYENELLEKTDIVKSIIDNATGKIQNRIFARKCEVKPIPHKEAQIFLNQNHLMGSTSAKHIGLYHQDELVSILSYKHKKRKSICNIERFCSKINMNIIGGFSKLLKHLESNYLDSNCQEIHNWVDLRYGTGKHLLNKGFNLKKETLGWRWTDFKTTYNRLTCRANMTKEKLSQKEYAKIRGLCKIYDAGQRLYIKRKQIP